MTSKKHHFKIFVDGASRNNPGPSGAGVFITHNGKTICKAGFYLGKKTNNQAEYLALLLAIILADEEAKKRDIPDPTLSITSDSELLVRQMTGQYRVRNSELVKIKRIIDLLCQEKRCTFTHVLREDNKIADQLANDGIDTKQEPPAQFLTLLMEHELEV